MIDIKTLKECIFNCTHIAQKSTNNKHKKWDLNENWLKNTIFPLTTIWHYTKTGFHMNYVVSTVIKSQFHIGKRSEPQILHIPARKCGCWTYWCIILFNYLRLNFRKTLKDNIEPTRIKYYSIWKWKIKIIHSHNWKTKTEKLTWHFLLTSQFI